MIVDCAVYCDGLRTEVGSDLAATLARIRSSGEGFLWLGLHEPSAEEFHQAGVDLGLHPLAVEDAVKAHQRPKLEEFTDSLFMVLRTVHYDEESQQVDVGELMVFLGDGFVVTVRHGSGSALREVRTQLEQQPALLAHGPSAVLHAACDQVVDDYEAVAALVEGDIDEVEARVFAPERSNEAGRIYNLKREVIEFRRSVRPLIEPLQRLASSSSPMVAVETGPFFRDVADHALRVNDRIESFHELLTSVLNANLAQVGVQQNNDMRRISAWVAIAAVPTTLGAVYGMNFTYMPELGARYGYFTVLAVIAVACAVLYRAFRRSGWL